MMYVVALLLALLIGWDLARQVNHYPGVFYGIAFVLDVLAILVAAFGLTGLGWDWLATLIGDGLLAFFLFCVVMFTGCFRLKSKPRMKLKQVRQPLALTSVILAAGHIAFTVVKWGTPEGLGLVFSLTCAILGLLLVVLGVTSIVAVQDRMNPNVLSKIQKLSYVFFLALCIHASFVQFLFGHWLPGAMYAAIAVIYLVTRLRNR